MHTVNIRELQRFNGEKMVKASAFASERLFYDVYCLEPGQAQKVHSHAGSDKVYLTLSGSPTVTIGDETRVLAPDECVLAAAGVAHGVSNPGPERAVLLVVTTPPPG